MTIGRCAECRNVYGDDCTVCTICGSPAGDSCSHCPPTLTSGG